MRARPDRKPVRADACEVDDVSGEVLEQGTVAKRGTAKSESDDYPAGYGATVQGYVGAFGAGRRPPREADRPRFQLQLGSVRG